jgi:hypothetical protein
MTLVLTSAGAEFQSITTQTAGAGNAATFALGAAPSGTFAVNGTFSATLTFEATVDGQTWYTLGVTKVSDGTTVSTTTATGLFAVTNTGLSQVRARCSSYSSGTAEVCFGSGLW